MKNNYKYYLELYRKELIIATVMALISIMLLVVTYSNNQEAFQKQEQLISERNMLKSEVNGLVKAEKLLADIGTRFETIRLNGFYGDEDRLSWGEALKEASQRLKLPNLKYSITPQEQVLDVAVGHLSGLILSQSVMKIEADLLHEGDLLTISEALSKQSGAYRLLGCELDKADDISIRKIQKNVSLNCTLAWYTVKYDASQENVVEDDIDMDI
ncbi:MAG: hypothetical protein COB26_04525 [Piscirickettsiaceae bacterium]|nr:MAG: hypothetical protein COB26_04525 [Piscirickettsiaceae bacterium]